MISGLEMERAYSGFGTSYMICHLLSYLDTYPLTYSPRHTSGRFTWKTAVETEVVGCQTILTTNIQHLPSQECWMLLSDIMANHQQSNDAKYLRDYPL